MTGQHVRSSTDLLRQCSILTGHCPLTGRYFKPWINDDHDHNHQDNDFYDDDDDDDNDTEMMIWAWFLKRWLSLTLD